MFLLKKNEDGEGNKDDARQRLANAIVNAEPFWEVLNELKNIDFTSHLFIRVTEAKRYDDTI